MAVTAAEILQDIEDYILTGGRRTRADKLRMILDKMVELTEQGGGTSFDAENITTDLKFANTTSNRILERRRLSGSILQYLSKLQFGDNDFRVIVEDWATGGVLKDYASYQIIGGTFHNWTVGNVPSGVSNSMQLLIDRLNLNKVARYSSALPLDNDLDLAYKKWVKDNFTAGLTQAITNSSVIAAITNNANYNDAFGNASPAYGGIWNTTLPSPIAENEYYIEPIGAPNGLPRSKIEVKKDSTGSLTIIKTPYIQ